MLIFLSHAEVCADCRGYHYHFDELDIYKLASSASLTEAFLGFIFKEY